MFKVLSDRFSSRHCPYLSYCLSLVIVITLKTININCIIRSIFQQLSYLLNPSIPTQRQTLGSPGHTGAGFRTLNSDSESPTSYKWMSEITRDERHFFIFLVSRTYTLIVKVLRKSMAKIQNFQSNTVGNLFYIIPNNTPKNPFWTIFPSSIF